MSPVLALPPPPVIWDYYLSGPFVDNFTAQPNASASLAQFLTPGYSPPAYNIATPRQMFTFSQGGGGVTFDRVDYRGILTYRKSTTAVATIEGMGGIEIIPRTDRSGLAAGYINPSWTRVNWLTVNMAMDAGTLDRNSGFLLFMTDGWQTTPVWPIAPALWQASANGGLGIFGDGAGNWNWESFNSSLVVPWPVLESVSLSGEIADPTDFHTFDFVFISATGTRPAVFQLHINGALALERNWETGTVLAPQPVATSGRWTGAWQVATTSDDKMYLADWVYRMGRFLPDGRELFA